MPASRILRLARTRRCARVGSGTRNARAISGVVSPPSVRSVSATRASSASAGWQHVKISRSRSSVMGMSASPPPRRRLDGRELRLDRRSRAELIGLLAQPPAAAQPVDRPVARGRRDPRPGVGGHAAVRPGLERGDERVLDGLLGEVEVAEDADQRRDRPALLLAEQAVDDLVRWSGRRRQSAPTAVGHAPARPPRRSRRSGRTSIEPCFAPGIIAANLDGLVEVGRLDEVEAAERSPWSRRTARRS